MGGIDLYQGVTIEWIPHHNPDLILSENGHEVKTIDLSGYTTEGLTFRLALDDLPTGTLVVVADDDGTGTGVIQECDEDNNELRLEGLCADE